MVVSENQKKAIKKYRQGNGREKVNANASIRYAKKATLPLRREFQRLSGILIS